MKTINLGRGYSALVDDEDYQSLFRFNWRAMVVSKTAYAVRSSRLLGKPIYVLMHRDLLGLQDSTVYVDHINGNGLDNTRLNLRLCTHAQNQRNRGPQVNNTTGYKGVSWCNQKNKFVVYINVAGKRTYLGSYKDKDAAAKAYDCGSVSQHGSFGYLNFKESK